ncbi:MAG: DUF4276 family protein [Candidatus Margulisbacteria bacterium]|jgi:hypothetical protein|nr:DUF4276 family protein [Candidatus Margulisiibacteriota bacterium]
MKVYIAGEDIVSFEIIRKALAYCSKDVEIISPLPARGGQIKSKIAEFNRLSSAYPVILLTDLDAAQCAPQFVRQLIHNKSKDFIFNVAVDEAEAWLMADRDGFSEYFSIKKEYLPRSFQTKQGGHNFVTEMNIPYKSSMYLTHNLITKSRKSEFIQQLKPKKGAAKGPEYNSCMIPFIQNKWNISCARKNTDSLNRMILRIEELIKSKIVK